MKLSRSRFFSHGQRIELTRGRWPLLPYLLQVATSATVGSMAALVGVTLLLWLR